MEERSPREIAEERTEAIAWTGSRGSLCWLFQKDCQFTVSRKFGLARLIWMIDEQADDLQEHSSIYGPKYQILV